ncbi:DUF4261 domain-containing protein [Flavobacterium quisquiliarum]|uniref:DUF4261 domain-containing protein n=1 Tax=Flavobacterium quisquiliarum TaxID=1834436 RepID=A0ABV8W7T7_9FLAO|nr:DUF4261 domain-containing protein [Flavobacterium quisquiliarum]MBW1656555.1 DUF4261 domain-containing protein [Flavobacterium quisquiliarum]NWL03776.1 hypothetical protein [Flavobacterium collinsii]
MGLFDFFKKKETSEKTEKTESNLLLAMPMFENNERYSIENVIQDLKDFWGLSVTDFTGDDNSAIFKINGELIAVAFVGAQIPWEDISGTAKYTYSWQTAEEDLKNFDGHAIVSVMSGPKSQLERFTILSKLLCSILSTSNSLGIYQGSQTLLISKSQYLEYIPDLQQQKSPIHLWIYIGIRTSEQGNSIYTYGLKEFGKQEMEVLNSQLPLEELYGFISNIIAYVIDSDVTFKNGETLGYTMDQKIKITSSQGILVEGQTLKLEM